MTDEPASERLLKASAVTAIDPEKTPAANFAANSNKLRKIPTPPQRIPYFLLTSGVLKSSFLINIFESSFINFFISFVRRTENRVYKEKHKRRGGSSDRKFAENLGFVGGENENKGYKA